MPTKPDLMTGFYFENDIGLAATALKEMFGDDVEDRVAERLEEIRGKDSDQQTRFWEVLLDEIRRRRVE